MSNNSPIFEIDPEDPIKSEALLTEYHSSNPNDIQSLSMLAFFRFQIGRATDEVMPLLEKIKKSNGQDFLYFITNAMISSSNGKFEMATNYFKQALDQYPNNPQLLLHTAISIIYTGKFDEAIEILKRVIEAENDNETAMAHLILCLTQTNKLNEAYNLVGNIDEKDIKTSELAINLAVLHQIEENYLKSNILFDKAIEIDPNNHLAYYNKGRNHMILNENDQALICFKKATELYPSNPYSCLAASAILEQKGKPYEALDLVQSISSNSMIPEFREILLAEEKRLVNLIANTTPTKNPIKLKMNDKDKIPTKVSLISNIGESSYKRSTKDSKGKNKNPIENSDNINHIMDEIQVNNEEKIPVENMKCNDESENNTSEKMDKKGIGSQNKHKQNENENNEKEKEREIENGDAAFTELTHKKINSPESKINDNPITNELKNTMSGKNLDNKIQKIKLKNSSLKSNNLEGKENSKDEKLNEEDENQNDKINEESSNEINQQRKIPIINIKQNSGSALDSENNEIPVILKGNGEHFHAGNELNLPLESSQINQQEGIPQKNLNSNQPNIEFRDKSELPLSTENNNLDKLENNLGDGTDQNLLSSNIDKHQHQEKKSREKEGIQDKKKSLGKVMEKTSEIFDLGEKKLLQDNLINNSNDKLIKIEEEGRNMNIDNSENKNEIDEEENLNNSHYILENKEDQIENENFELNEKEQNPVDSTINKLENKNKIEIHKQLGKNNIHEANNLNEENKNINQIDNLTKGSNDVEIQVNEMAFNTISGENLNQEQFDREGNMEANQMQDIVEDTGKLNNKNFILNTGSINGIHNMKKDENNEIQGDAIENIENNSLKDKNISKHSYIDINGRKIPKVKLKETNPIIRKDEAQIAIINQEINEERNSERELQPNFKEGQENDNNDELINNKSNKKIEGFQDLQRVKIHEENKKSNQKDLVRSTYSKLHDDAIINPRKTQTLLLEKLHGNMNSARNLIDKDDEILESPKSIVTLPEQKKLDYIYNQILESPFENDVRNQNNNNSSKMILDNEVIEEEQEYLEQNPDGMEGEGDWEGEKELNNVNISPIQKHENKMESLKFQSEDMENLNEVFQSQKESNFTNSGNQKQISNLKLNLKGQDLKNSSTKGKNARVFNALFLKSGSKFSDKSSYLKQLSGKDDLMDQISLNEKNSKLLQEMNDWDIKKCENTLAEQPDNLLALYKAGILYFREEKNYEKSLNYLERVWQSDKNIRPLEVLLSIAYIYNKIYKNYEKAIDYYSEAKEYTENVSEIDLQIGRLYEKMGKLTESSNFYKLAYKSDSSNPEYLIRLGKMFIKTGKAEEGINMLEEVQSNHPENLDVIMSLATIHLKNQEYDLAEAYANKYIEIDKNSWKPFLILGQISLKNQDYDKAASYFEEVYKQNPTNTTLINQLAKLYEMKGDYSNALKYYNISYEIDNENPKVLNKLASLYQMIGEYENSKKILEFLLSKNFTDSDTVINLSKMYLKSGKNLEEGIKLLEDIIRNNPNNIDAQIMLGKLLNKKKDYKNGASILSTILKTNPNNVNGLSAMAEFLLETGQKNLSLKYYLKINSLDPKNLDGLLNLGYINQLEGKYDIAIKYYHQSLNIKEDQYDIHYNLGNLYAEQNKFENAKIHYNRCSDLNPQNAESLYNLGVVQVQQKDYKNAIESFTKALEIDKANPYIYYNLGNSYFLLSDFQRAIENYKLGLELNPNIVEIQLSLSRALKSSKKLKEAISVISKAIEKHKDNKDLYVEAATIYKMMNNHKKAFEFASEALKIQPNDPESQAIIDSLKK